MLKKLEDILQKYNKLSEEMADSAVIAQPEKWTQCDYFDFVIAEVHGVRPAELVEFQKNGGKVFGI